MATLVEDLQVGPCNLPFGDETKPGERLKTLRKILSIVEAKDDVRAMNTLTSRIVASCLAGMRPLSVTSHIGPAKTRSSASR